MESNCPAHETALVLSISKADSAFPGRPHDVVRRVHSLALAQSVLDRNSDNMRRLQGYHVAPLFLLDGPHCRAAEPAREQPIVTRGHSAALQMSQDQRACFFAGDLLDLVCHAARDAAHATLLTR